MTRLTLAAALLVSGCGLDVHNRPERRWIGQVTPTADPSHCPASRGVLVLRDGEVKFAPNEGTWVLDGRAQGDTIDAAQSRLNPDHQTYQTTLHASWTERSVQGTYTTPRCSYRVDLSSF